MQKRINIVDVLKPAEDYIEIVENNCKYWYTRAFLIVKYNRDTCVYMYISVSF